MLLKKEQFVINEKKPEWGIGKVIDMINQDLAEIFFEHGGYRKFLRKNNPLVEADISNMNTTIFNNINIDNIDEEKKNLYQDLPSSQDHFLQAYPGGFSGKKYIDREREYKDEGHTLGIELLNQEVFNQLLQNHNYGDITARVLKVVNKLNLLFPNEKMALKDGLKDEKNQEQFAQSLYNLLYGSDVLEIRFEGWIKTLEAIGADKWTTASYFLFVLFPDKYMFVKPTITQAVADMSAFDIAYTPRLNWNTYSKILNLSNYLMKELHKLKPKDMIDVQSFMWCINQQADS